MESRIPDSISRPQSTPISDQTPTAPQQQTTKTAGKIADAIGTCFSFFRKGLSTIRFFSRKSLPPAPKGQPSFAQAAVGRAAKEQEIRQTLQKAPNPPQIQQQRDETRKITEKQQIKDHVFDPGTNLFDLPRLNMSHDKLLPRIVDAYKKAIREHPNDTEAALQALPNKLVTLGLSNTECIKACRDARQRFNEMKTEVQAEIQAEEQWRRTQSREPQPPPSYQPPRDALALQRPAQKAETAPTPPQTPSWMEPGVNVHEYFTAQRALAPGILDAIHTVSRFSKMEDKSEATLKNCLQTLRQELQDNRRVSQQVREKILKDTEQYLRKKYSI